MYEIAEQRLRRLLNAGDEGLLRGGKKGLEKESLRVTVDGAIAQSPHPEVLGSTLTHPYITTDYSEALLELITPPSMDVAGTVAFLSEIHQYVYQYLDDELLWAASMPCAVGDDKSIPIALYGTSNVGMMKHVYRRGLEYRYGRRMQAISGVHFNYSLAEEFWPVFQDEEDDAGCLQDFVADKYFALIRNFLRYEWLVLYLFGSSPAVCKSFLTGSATRFEEFDTSTYYLPYATSLRMSDIGYKNKNQAVLNVAYNSLDEYVSSLTRAIETPYPEYEAVGVMRDGEYIQLNTNILQIENEFYSFVRPKQTTLSGEKPTVALKRRGVQYVEIRALDVGLLDPCGVNDSQLRFLEALLLFCLLHDSPLIDAQEQRDIEYNERTVALRGREPDLQLQENTRARSLVGWMHEILEQLEPLCGILDGDDTTRPYRRALAEQSEKLADPGLLPSATILSSMRARKLPFAKYAMELSQAHLDHFRALSLTSERLAELRAIAEQSLDQQRATEAADTLSFPEYLQRYFTQRL